MERGLINMNFPQGENGPATMVDSLVLVDFMDMFDPMLTNEDWAWYSQPHI
jgi:hypothetical protein